MPGSINRQFCLEALEGRTMLAVTALAMSTTSCALGNMLVVNGTSGDDRIYVTNTSSGIQISNSTGWSTFYTGPLAMIKVLGGAGNDRITIDANIRIPAVLYGGAGVDSLIGGSGNDSLYGGDGRDYLYGQAGDDTLVSIGDGSIDRLYGGAGIDGFWCDSGSDELVIDSTIEELAVGAIHRISNFLSGTFGSVTLNAPITLSGQKLADPTLAGYATGYQNFSDRPLFSKNGPTADDIFQGALGDCYLLASLGSVAKANAQIIRQSVVALGDGTFCVQFSEGSTRTYVRVDGDLPIAPWGLAYASFGKQQSIWAAVIEKAYAFFRYKQGSYGSIEGGFMADVYSHMGRAATSLFSASSATNLLQRLQADLAAGKAVTFGTKSNVGNAPCTGGHAYMVDAVLTDSNGNVVSLRLRNPWGVDDTAGHGANDGYITLTAAQAMQAFWFACSANAK